ncbi:hypothetical protein P7D22_19560 [Lichenihabitans sp. Uapishka_5]|uniref:hypothetical protein n=1 Tax=Lichenihabitans sp. Uapishka_5 TaxID=3037302 RepID=UPI0029E7E0D2|nr:hypothetical protein [Lichenihabitans sp. Uapishka_5]MDX7953365.1 hypothetical protein [Lichenihabitans sp. Uapishka_5]
MHSIHHPEATAIIAVTSADSRAIAVAARKELAGGRPVNILFDHKGERSLVARIIRYARDDFYVGHASQLATRHTGAGHAVMAAVERLERHEREAISPKHARLGRA